MKFIVWVETRLAGKTLELQQVASLERPSTGIQPEEIGLTLQDGKTVLSGFKSESCRLKSTSRVPPGSSACIASASNG